MRYLKITTCIFLFGLSLFLAKSVRAEAEFISIIDPGQGTGYDFDSLSGWEAVTQVNLATTTTKVFSHGGIVGAIPDWSTLVGTTSGAVASTTRVTATQILLHKISGTFVSGEKLYIQGGSTNNNYVYITDSGDSAIAVAKCRTTDGSADTNNVTVDGWTTATSTYIKIWTDPTDPYGRHPGRWDESKYQLIVAYGFAINENYVQVDGLQIRTVAYVGNTTNILITGQDSQSNSFNISNNILTFVDTGDDDWYPVPYGISLHNDYLNANIWNNVMYGFRDETNTEGIAMVLEVFNFVNVYNNTIFDSRMGARKNYGYNLNLKNNLVQDCDTDFYVNMDNTAASYNLSSDWTAPGTNSYTTTTVTFVDSTNDDFHLSPSDSTAKDAGVNLTWNASFSFTTDIDGTARGSAWDIGADEVPMEYISTICQATSTGGDCIEMDYSYLAQWEDAVESDLTATNTRVFAGAITGNLLENDTVSLYRSGVYLTATGTVVATTSDQILVDGIWGTTTPVVAKSGDQWRKDGSNYWTIGTTTDVLSLDAYGASPIAVAKIDGSWTASDTDMVDINGWTTDHDNYVRIYTASAARHNGKWDNAKYRMHITSASYWDYAIAVATAYAQIDGLQIYYQATSEGGKGIRVSGSLYGDNNINNLTTISNNIISSNSVSTDTYGIGPYADPGYPNADVYNNIIYNIGGLGINTDNPRIWHVYNNTVFNCGNIGIHYAGDGVLFHNNLSFNNANADFSGSAIDPRSSHNASSDDTADNDTANSIINLLASSTFISPYGYDFHLLNTATSVINAGVDLSSTSTLSVLTDIDGSARDVDGLGYDIGADETATEIYRSIGNHPVENLNFDNRAVTIAGYTATFSDFTWTIVGVGDVIQYGGDGYWQLAIITGRASSTEYSVLSAAGSAPTATTSAVARVYRAYTSLANWQALDENNLIDDAVENFDTSRDLVASGTAMNVAGYADNIDTSNVIVTGWTTGAQNDIRIFAPQNASEVGVSQRHEGVWDESRFYALRGAINDDTLNIAVDYITLEGLQISSTDNNSDCGGWSGSITLDNAATLNNNLAVIRNNIVRRGACLSGTGISLASWSDYHNVHIYNNIVYDFNANYTPCIGAEGTAHSRSNNVWAYNNTLYNCYYGFYSGWGARTYALNNIVQQAAIGYYDSSYFDAVSDYNIADDGGYIPGANSQSDVAVEFFNELGDDFHLTASDAVAIDTGTSSPRDSIVALQNDIDGHQRRTWDIGADEAGVEFVSTVMESGGDFSSLINWETANQVDLTATTTAVYTCAVVDGFMPVGATVTGTTSGATANVSVMATSSSQILLYNITASSTGSEFVAGEKIYVQGQPTTSNFCLLISTSNGNPAIAVAKVDGAWTSAETNVLSITGWETGRYNYIKIYTTDAARHDGKWNAGKYRFDGGGSNPFEPLRIYEEYTRIDGLQFGSSQQNRPAWWYNDVVGWWPYTDNGTLHFSNNIIYIYGAPDVLLDHVTGISLTQSNASAAGVPKAYLWNNLFINTSRYDGSTRMGYGIRHEHRQSLGYIYNNNFVGWEVGSYNSGSELREDYLHNNIFYNNTTDTVNQDTARCDFNATNQASLGYTAAANDRVSQTFSFVDEAINDYHLLPEDTAAKNFGINLAATGTVSFSTDLDGQTRYDTGWDIGVDEAPTIIYRSVGNDTSNLNINNYTVTITPATSSVTATFSGDMPANMGVGDVLQYGTPLQLAIISGRTSSSTYSVQSATGSPVTATTSSAVSVYRAYQYFYGWNRHSTEYVNPGISDTVDEYIVMNSRDLVASNTAMYVPCYASTSPDIYEGDVPIVSGWTTATSTKIKIYTPFQDNEVGVSQRHSGIWSEDAYRLYSDTGDIIRVNDEDVEINGLQLRAMADLAAGINFNSGISYNIIVANNIIDGASSSYDNNKGILMGDSATNFSLGLIYNNIIYGWGRNYSQNIGINVSGNIWSVDIYNNTINNNYWGVAIEYTPNVTLKNNAIFNNTDDFYGTFTLLDYNASDDGDGTNPVDLSPPSRGTEAAGWTAAFADWENYDFRVRDAASVLYNSGTTITAVTTDIANNSRPYNADYDIGAHEFSGSDVEFLIKGNVKFKGFIKFK